LIYQGLERYEELKFSDYFLLVIEIAAGIPGWQENEKRFNKNSFQKYFFFNTSLKQRLFLG